MVIVIIWIISSTLNNEINDTNADTDTDANLDLDETNAQSDDFYKVEGKNIKDSGEISMMNISKTDPETYEAYNNYIKDRVAAIKAGNPDMDSDDILDIQKQAALEFKTALQKGKVLSVEDNKIVETNLESDSSKATNATDANDVIDSDSVSASSTKLYLPEGNIKTTISYANEPKEIYDMKINYINKRYEAIKKAYPNLSGSRLAAWRNKASLEFNGSFAHGKILKIENGKITDINKDEFINALNDPKEYLESTGALKGDTANLDVIQNLDDKYTASELIKAGVNNIKFKAYGINVNMNLAKISDADKNLNPLQLAEKYIKSVAKRAAEAKATEEELGI